MVSVFVSLGFCNAVLGATNNSTLLASGHSEAGIKVSAGIRVVPSEGYEENPLQVSPSVSGLQPFLDL